jgi:hypothetical protein
VCNFALKCFQFDPPVPSNMGEEKVEVEARGRRVKKEHKI